MTFLFRRQAALLLHPCLAMISSTGILLAAETITSQPPATFRQYCFQCHGKAAMGGINLEQLSGSPSIGESFQHWEKVVSALETKRMPPAKLKQPTDEERQTAVRWIRARLDGYIKQHAGEPGKVTVRRLTSGEYTYSIRDLTGVDLKFDRDFASDSVGGEGFTNFGDVQFMEDANLERYLEAAKRVSEHAVIGSGSLVFFEHPGQSGFEMSAVARIQNIYRSHGFRMIAGEGARPYGLDLYGKALYTAWRYRNRQALGLSAATLEQIAVKDGGSARFARHMWSLLNSPKPTYPISDVVARWRKLPAGTEADSAARAKAECEEIQQFIVNWPRWVFAAGPMESLVGDDKVFVLTDDTLKANTKQSMRYLLRPKRGQKTATVYLSVPNMNPASQAAPFVTWKNGMVRVLKTRDRREAPPAQPLKSMLSEATIKTLGYGKAPDGTALDDKDFAIPAGGSVAIELAMPEGAFGLALQFETSVNPELVADSVLRPTFSDNVETTKGRTESALLANPDGTGYKTWKAGVLEFAAQLPQNSHGEPTPSDRDPIPLPFSNAYNQPERDRFHTKVKYYRSDKYLVDNILDDANRKELDQAWTDVYASFDYHNAILRFISDKYKLDIKKGIAELDETEIAAIPAEPQKYVKALRTEYDSIQKSLRAARPGHVEDCLKFAANAWRRPLTEQEKNQLRGFYTKVRTGPELDHQRAIRSLLTRALVAPAFLYRLEQPSTLAADRALSNWEMASRLSYFLWSSIPDAELRRAAAARELTTDRGVEKQVRRMLADPKARRFSTEFFGQWLGFYRFDQHRGVDAKRFPEFTDEVKGDMYDEAVSFFEHVARKDRPIHEIYDANYTFLTKALANHYGVKKEIKSTTDPELVEGANEFHRGGLLRLGAVLTATSAPLRTSPVKRGDWVLRRILGTPTPPPPPDAGSIPADDKLFGGMTVKQRLDVHKRNATCAGCHTRIDPLGFPLEKFDSVGRWREAYSDGKAIEDSSALADKSEIAGVDGLLKFLNDHESQVLKNMSNKLVGYALGRTVLASDQPLIQKMVKSGSDATFATLAVEIAKSHQFRFRRDQAENPTSVAPPLRQTKNKPSESKVGGL